MSTKDAGTDPHNSNKSGTTPPRKSWTQILEELRPYQHAIAQLPADATEEEMTEVMLRVDAVRRSVDKFEAFADEAEAGMLENAYDLGLVDSKGVLNESKFETAVVKAITPKDITSDDKDNHNPVLEWILRDARKNADAAAAFERPQRKYRNLTEALAAPREKTKYLVSSLAIEGENILISAQYKAGKTTFVIHLAGCLASGKPFLGFDVANIDGNITIWDTELEESYALDQLEALGLETRHSDKIVREHLKGYSIPLETVVAKRWAIETLKADSTEIWIIDTFGAIFNGEENNAAEVRAWLHSVDEIKRLAGVKTVILVTHAGHDNKGRARGSSYFGGWSGANWSIERVTDDKNVRALTIGTGRGVAEADIYYSWTPEDGIGVADAPETEKSRTRQEMAGNILLYVTKNPRSSITNIVKGCEYTGGQRNTVSDILQSFVEQGRMTMEQVGQSKLYSVVPIAVVQEAQP